MKSIRYSLVAIGVIAALAALANQACATIISTPDKNETGFTLAQDALGESATVTAVGLGWCQDPTKLQDGILGDIDGDWTKVNGIDAANTSITYTFPTNSFGYDITGIQTYAGWSTDAGGRSNQGYEVKLTFVDNSTATLLAKATWEANDPASSWTRVVHANDGGGVLDNGSGGVVATGVKSITFADFDAARAGSYIVGYREIEIYGTASVPEPGTIILLLTGLFGLLAYAWRKRR